MSISSPVPPPADVVRPSRSHTAVPEGSHHMASVVTRTSAIEIGLVLSLISMSVTGAGAYFTLRKDVDQLQGIAREGQALAKSMSEEMQRRERERDQEQAQRDLTLLNVQRDVTEVRGAVERIEAAISPGARVRR